MFGFPFSPGVTNSRVVLLRVRSFVLTPSYFYRRGGNLTSMFGVLISRHLYEFITLKIWTRLRVVVPFLCLFYEL